ncbi:MAG: hypothetical protein AAF411_25010 [Myxococcota bacterium]
MDGQSPGHRHSAKLFEWSSEEPTALDVAADGTLMLGIPDFGGFEDGDPRFPPCAVVVVESAVLRP